MGLISFLRHATNLSIIKDSSMLRHGPRLICIISYNDHNFVKFIKTFQNLATSEKSVTLIFLQRKKSDICVT